MTFVTSLFRASIARHKLNGRKLIVALAVAGLSFPVSRAAAEPLVEAGDVAAPSRAQNPITGRELTAAQAKAVERGLKWLATHQAGNGAFTVSKEVAGQTANAGITALGALAMMESGSLPDRGPYGAEVSRALAFVMSKCTESGLIASDSSPMYGHGFATLFLAEVYGMGTAPDTAGGTGGGGGGVDEVREKLTRAVRLIERAQCRDGDSKDGGWRYRPVPDEADISVTICQIMALRAARDAGIKVDKSVIDRAISYIKRCQNADGGFSYQASRAPGPADGGSGGAQVPGGGAANIGGLGVSNFARTSAGIASLFYAGIYQGSEINAGLTYLKKAIATRGKTDEEGHFYYANYYGVQAMFLAGGDYWGGYYPMIRDQLIARQQPDGSWKGDFTDEYATAMALIILQVPNRYLPVYAGKGTGN